jgi:ferritin-like metal-binding protein YciE
MIALAEKSGRQDAVPLLQQCLQEKAMAEWLHAHMASTLERYLELRAREGRAAAH